jgi:Flp pilus assembly protein TadG
VTRLVSARLRADDAGSAIVEFVFVAVVVMIPLVYLIVAVAVMQRTQLAVSQAAREAGRAFATATSGAAAPGRVEAAVRIALSSHGVPSDVEVRFVAAGAPCSSRPVAAALVPGAQLTICVTRRASVPAVPSVLAGRGITCVGRYTVHVDDYRTVRP